jgi:hypothetical protein
LENSKVDFFVRNIPKFKANQEGCTFGSKRELVNRMKNIHAFLKGMG